MKKTLLILGIFLSFSLASCGKPKKTTTTDSTPTTTESGPKETETTTTSPKPSGVDDGGDYSDSYSWGELH